MITANLHKACAAALLTLGLPLAGWSQAPLLVDSFESGDMSATNKDGFQWQRNNRTSIVTPDQVVWNNGPRDVARPAGRDWEPKTGNHALRFNYPAGEPQSEQRFKLGQAYEEIWFSFWLKVPHNYKHTGGNRKLFALWMDNYSAGGKGATITWQFWKGKGDYSKLAVGYGYTEEGKRTNDGQKHHTKFIEYPKDNGRWMQMVFQARSTKPGRANGVIRTWQRWEGEAEFKKLHEVKNASLNIPENGPQGWANGYVLGWANDGYHETTEWIIDDFTVSEHSLIEEAPVRQAEAPEPPQSLLGQAGQ